MFVIHAFVWLFLAFTAARGVSARARSVGAWARGVLELALPELKKLRDAAVAPSVSASQLPDASQLLRACAVRRRCVRPLDAAQARRRAAAPPVTASGTQQWKELLYIAVCVSRRAMDASEQPSAETIAAELDTHASAVFGETHNCCSLCNRETYDKGSMVPLRTAQQQLRPGGALRSNGARPKASVLNKPPIGDAAAPSGNFPVSGNLRQLSDFEHTVNHNRIGFQQQRALGVPSAHLGPARRGGGQGAAKAARAILSSGNDRQRGGAASGL